LGAKLSNSQITALASLPDHEESEPARPSESSATRHLCAGVYRDRSFRDLVIRKVHNDPRRRVAPSYGFDLVPVVRNAWHAWFLDAGLHGAVLGCLVIGLAFDRGLAVVVVLCAFGVCLTLWAAGHNLSELLVLRASKVAKRWSERHERRSDRRTDRELERRKRLLKASLAGAVALGMTPVIVSMIVGAALRSALSDAAVMAGVLAVCCVVVGVLRQLRLNATHRAKSVQPAKLTQREKIINAQQEHECVIYQRPEHKQEADPLERLLDPPEAPTPFVGAGKLVNRWQPPLTIQLVRPDPSNTQDWTRREHVTPPFRAHELVDRLRSALAELGTDPGRENLPGLRVRHRLYVAEADVSADRLLLSENPRFLVRRIIDNHQAFAHHFLETTVPIAGGELVATVLIRVSLKGRCLSLDVATCALTRTPHDFHVIDRYAEHGVSAVVRAGFRSLFTLPANVMRAWRLVELPVVLGRALWAIKDRTHKPRRGVQVGARVAIRERASDDWKNAQLDETTIYDHMKIVEQRVLRATEDFLRARDVDTSAFEKQATSIINSGVLNMGGENTMDHFAVGTSAQVLLNVAADLKEVKKG
jgi:hypothetical protein